MQKEAEIEPEVRLQVQLQDHEGKNVGFFHNLYFYAEDKVDKLTKQIKQSLAVKQDYQQVFDSDGNQFPLAALAASGTLLKNTEIAKTKDHKIFVKHSMCQRWKEYVLLIESLMKLSEREEKSSESKGREKIKKMKEVAREAAEHLEAIDPTDFFVVYGDLKIERQKNIKRSGFVLLYLEEVWFKKAVVAYFKKSPEMEVKAEKPEKGGVQQSLLVDINGRESTYYAKVLGNIKKNYGTWPFDKPPVDLREIFVYRLLSSIGVGSKEVHVIPDVPNSGYVYLATKMIEGFFTADGYSEDNLRTGSEEKVTVSKRVANDTSGKESVKEAEEQLAMLGWLLHLSDLGEANKANHGFVVRLMNDGTNLFELRIVDFQVAAKGEAPAFVKAKGSKISGWKKFAEGLELNDKIDEALEKMKEDLAIRKRFEEDKNAYEDQNQEEQNLFDYFDGVKNRLKELVKEQQSGSGAAKKPRTD